MDQKIISRSAFATLANVTPGAVTRAAKTTLRDAAVGSRIDANHADALQYVRDIAAALPKKSETGMDVLYDEAVTWCQLNETYSANAIKTQFKIGSTRATRIFKMMQLAEAVPKTEKDVKAAAKSAKGRTGKAGAKKSASPGAEKAPPPPVTISADKVPEDIRAFRKLTLEQIIEGFGTDTRFKDFLDATKKIEDIAEKRTKNAVARGELIERDFVVGQITSLLDVAFKRLVSDVPKTVAGEILAMFEAEGEGITLPVLEKVLRESNSVAIKTVKTSITRRLE